MDRPKLLIVDPAGSQGWWNGGKVLAPPLALPHLAGLTPKSYEIRLVDENVENVIIDDWPDLVAISCMTASAYRAYEIAFAFRLRGIPVVMGGIHPTVMPDEASRYADAIVIGEAELVWKNLLSDFEASSLKSRYQGPDYCKMEGMPIPRRDLLKRKRYLSTGVVQTARGCSNNCSFCSVSAIFGKRCRFRPIPEVIEEIRTLKSWVGFVDDNITGVPSRAKELFEALIPLGIHWVGQGDLNMAKDQELLRLAALSGCKAMFIGFESLSQKNLIDTNKHPNIGLDMPEAIRKIHKAGIEIIVSLVFGLDEDDSSTFDEALEFVRVNGVGALQCSVLTPFPGTEMRKKLESENRILHNRWPEYTMSNVAFQPKNMSVEELVKGQRLVYDTFYSYPEIAKRSLKLRRVRHRNVLLTAGVGVSYHRIRHNKGLTWGLPKK